MALAPTGGVDGPFRSVLRPGSRRRRHAFRALFLLFAAVVFALILQRARDLDWAAVGAALGDYDVLVIAVAAACALGAHAAAASYDLIGRLVIGHGIAASKVFLINGVAFPFSLNLGALVGGWGFRARLYSRFGLGVRPVMEIIALAVVTNWSGYVLVGGVLLAVWPLPLPEPWAVNPRWLQLLGVVMLAVVCAYIALCHVATRRHWRPRVRGVAMHLPAPPLALLQLAVSSASWLLMSLALHMLLPGEVPFVHVASVLLICAVAGAALHVPGSLGVLEIGVLRLLPTDAAPAATLAAVLGFRALYYILPFMIGAVAYGALELSAHRRARRGSRSTRSRKSHDDAHADGRGARRQRPGMKVEKP